MNKDLIRRIVHLLPRRVKNLLRRVIVPPLESLLNVPDLFRDYRYLHSHSDFRRIPGGWFYKGQVYPDYLTVGGASYAIFRTARKFCKGQGVDIGAGLWPLPDAVPVDACRGPGCGKSISDFGDSSLDYIFSSHCLEHIERWQEALQEWVSKLKPGGIIFLYLPHPECAIWNQGSPFVGDRHKWIPTADMVIAAVERFGCEVIDRDDGPDAMFSFYICGQKGGLS